LNPTKTKPRHQVHVSDWFPTLLDAAAIAYVPVGNDGGGNDDTTGPYPIDGISFWHALTGIASPEAGVAAGDGPRKELLHQPLNE
jgi:hypothetical protein